MGPGGTNRVLQVASKVKTLEKRLEKILAKRNLIEGLSRSSLYDKSSEFWRRQEQLVIGIGNWEVIDAYCAWQACANESKMIESDLRRIYNHARDDQELLLSVLEHKENRHFARSLISARVALLQERRDTIYRFFASWGLQL
jgi:hypothetical protein